MGMQLVDIKAELKKQADVIATRIGKPGGDFIKVQQDKKFKLPDGSVSDGPLTVVIVDFVSGNFFYDRPYKDGEQVPPACFAIGTEPELLKPHETSPDIQSETCKTCANNEFGSAGKGKACTNTRLLAVTAPTNDAEAPVYNLKVSPTAIRAFDAYVKTIQAQFDAPPIAVVTEIYFDPDLKYPSLRFGNPTPNDNLEIHFNRQKVARDRLLVAPDVSQYEPPAKPAPRKK
jgi:hypothetical protein